MGKKLFNKCKGDVVNLITDTLSIIEQLAQGSSSLTQLLLLMRHHLPRQRQLVSYYQSVIGSLNLEDRFGESLGKFLELEARYQEVLKRLPKGANTNEAVALLLVISSMGKDYRLTREQQDWINNKSKLLLQQTNLN